MKTQLWSGLWAGVAGAATLVAWSRTSGGGGGTGGSTTAGGSGGGSFGGASSGGGSFGGASSGGGSFGGASSGGASSGGSSSGGSSSGGGSSVTLPSGCVPAGLQTNCNPVTNQGCASGEACDLASQQGGGSMLKCFGPPNTQKLGQACSNGDNGPFCEGTMRCDDEVDGGGGKCKKYCCAKSDCGGGTCTPFEASAGTLGTCD